MGLARIAASDPARNILITIIAMVEDDGTPVDPVTAALPVTVAFVAVGGSPDGAAWRAADWVTAADGTFRARCKIGSAATGTLAAGMYQPYIQVVSGDGETTTVPAADVLEAY